MSVPKRRRLQIERLEDRRLMAGDVAAVLSGGNLYLSEAYRQAGQDNGVLVSQDVKGQIRIEGIAAVVGGEKSLINGQTAAAFIVPGGLIVNFGGGDDKVVFAYLGEQIRLQQITLNMGSTSASLGVSDNDEVSLANFQTTGSVSINTGAGDDDVRMHTGLVGDGLSRVSKLTIRTGAGTDTVTVKFGVTVRGVMDVQTFDALRESDRDELILNNIVLGSLYVRTGGGDDSFRVTEPNAPAVELLTLHVAGSMLLDTGSGVDTVDLSRINVGNANVSHGLTLRTGSGPDTVFIHSGWFANLDIQTYEFLDEVEVDYVELQTLYVEQQLLVRLGGGDDEFVISDLNTSVLVDSVFVDGSLIVDTGAGNDAVRMEGVSVNSQFGGAAFTSIRTGTGNDTVDLRNSLNLGSVEIQTYETLAEADWDRVDVVNIQFLMEFAVRLGGGHDVLNMSASVGRTLTIETGDGSDTATLTGISAIDDFMADMGEDADTLILDAITAGRLILLGGGGHDHLYRTNGIYVDEYFEIGWEALNGFEPVVGNILIPTKQVG